MLIFAMVFCSFGIGIIPAGAALVAPSNIVATVLEGSKVNLTWTDNSDNEIKFVIKSNNIKIGEVPANQISYQVTGLTEKASIGLTVSACLTDYACQSSSFVYVTTGINPPANLVVASSASPVIKLTWEDKSSVEQMYYVERSLKQDADFVVIGTLGSNVTAYDDTTVDINTSYYYRVRAGLGSLGDSDYSNVASGIYSDGTNLNWISSIPTIGDVTDIEVAGDYTYVASTEGFQVIDSSTPSKPLIKSSIKLVSSSIAIYGRYALINDLDKSINFLKIIDILNPLSPYIVSSVQIPTDIYDISVSGHKAYIANAGLGITIINIANPLVPSIQKTIDTPGTASRIAVSGNYAYVADNEGGLHVIDASNPNSASIVTSLDLSAHTKGIDIDGNYLFVTTKSVEGSLQIFDITNPLSPQRVSQVRSPSVVPGLYNTSFDIKVLGDYAYINSSDGTAVNTGIQTVNIADPVHPAQTDYSTFQGVVLKNISAKTGLLAIASGAAGVTYLDISTPSKPVWSSEVLKNTFMYTPSISYDGRYLFVSVYYSLKEYVYIYDTQDIKNPVQIGRCLLGSSVYSMVVRENYLYVGNSREHNQFTVVNVTDKSNPHIASSVDLPDIAYDINIVGTRAYLANAAAGLTILDLSDPALPTILKTVDTPGYARDVDVAGNYAYIADGTVNNIASMKVVKIDTPSTASVVGSVTFAGNATEISVSGNYAYVASSRGGLNIINIANPTSPIIRKKIPVDVSDQNQALTGVGVVGNIAYVSSGSLFEPNRGIKRYNIINPLNPIQVGFLPSAANHDKLTISDRLIFAPSNSPSVLQIADLYYDQLKIEQTSTCGSTLACTSVSPNQEITYNFTITNSTPYTLTNLDLLDAVPAGVTYIPGSVSSGGTYEVNQVRWTNMSIPAKNGTTDGKLEMSFRARVN